MDHLDNPEDHSHYLHQQSSHHDPVANSSHLYLPEHGLDYTSRIDEEDAEATAVAAAAAVAAVSSGQQQQQQQQQHSQSSLLPLADASPFSRHLGRNRACASCRDRKLKCDGMRPICGQCSRAWATRKRSLKSKGASDADLQNLEQPCLYLKAPQREQRGSSGSKAREGRGKQKMKQAETPPLEEIQREKERLEMEVAQLRSKLQSQSGILGKDMVQTRPNSDELSIAELLATTMRSGDSFPQPDSRPPSIPPIDAQHLHSFVGSLTGPNGASNIVKFASASLDANNIYHHPLSSIDFHSEVKEPPIDPLLLGTSTSMHYKQEDGNDSADDLTQVILSSWPADFPAPATVDLLCQVFFDQCHYLRCLFQPGQFFAQLAHGPGSRQFPSHAVLHAIFALAYTLRPDLDPANHTHTSTGSSHHVRLPTLVSAKYHCERVKNHLSSLNGQGISLLAQCKAAIILANVKFGHGQMLEAWTASGTACRIATALSLNRRKVESNVDDGRIKVDVLSTSLLPPPTSWLEDEERRRVMFLAYATEQAGSASFLWTSGTKEADVESYLPMYGVREFQTEQIETVMSEGQTLQSADLFSRHRTNDSLEVFIKGLILVGRCGEYLSHLPHNATIEDVKTPAWYHLNHLVSTFASTANTLIEDQRRDPLRLVTAITIQTCTLQLHEPMARVDDQCLSMCRASCTGITNTCRFLAASDAEVTSFSPMFAFGIGVAGRVLVRLLDMACNPGGPPRSSQCAKYPTQQHDGTFFAAASNASVENYFPSPYAQMPGLGGAISSNMQKMLQDDIDVVFIFLCKYGRIWPLAMRQAKAMAEQLGIKVSSPELLSHGIFTDRNSGNHIYR